MPKVRLERRLHVPADPAAQALGEILQAISQQEGPWRGFALHIGLGDLHLPDVGYVAVPIELKYAKHPDEGSAFDVEFNAANLPGAFPWLKATLGVRPAELGASALYLDGDYEIPLHFFGRLLDAALIPGVAKRSLENFIGEVGAACEARVDQREAEFARFHYYGVR